MEVLFQIVFYIGVNISLMLRSTPRAAYENKYILLTAYTQMQEMVLGGQCWFKLMVGNYTTR